MVLDIIKGKKFAKKDGSLVDAEKVFADNKVICFYFSAHWCPPCRQFTPVLKDFYEDLSENGDVAIVFVSSDRDEASMQQYFSEHGDYYCVPFEDKGTISNLKSKFGISGIPSLIVVKSDGSEISRNGRQQVMSGNPMSVRKEWLAA